MNCLFNFFKFYFSNFTYHLKKKKYFEFFLKKSANKRKEFKLTSLNWDQKEMASLSWLSLLSNKCRRLIQISRIGFSEGS